jgi:hypothetical protein
MQRSLGSKQKQKMTSTYTKKIISILAIIMVVFQSGFVPQNLLKSSLGNTILGGYGEKKAFAECFGGLVVIVV